jgi:hypothetical protein
VPRSAVSFHWRRPGLRIWSAVALAVLVVGVILIARLVGNAVGPGRTPTPEDGSAAGPTTTATTGDDSVYAGPSASAGTGKVSAAALQVGEGFVRAWLQPPAGVTQARWFQGLSRYADQGLAAQMKAVDPATNPATKITGAAAGTVLSPTSAQITVPTDAGTASVLCVRTAAGWRASTVDLA